MFGKIKKTVETLKTKPLLLYKGKSIATWLDTYCFVGAM